MSVTVSKQGKGLNIYAQELSAVLPDLAQDLTDFAYQRLRENCPVKSGAMRDSITQQVSGLTGKVEVTASYAVYVEKGTPPHPIIGKPILHWVDDAGEDAFATKVMHPGTQAQEFVKQTRVETKDNSLQVWRRLYDANLK